MRSAKPSTRGANSRRPLRPFTQAEATANSGSSAFDQAATGPESPRSDSTGPQGSGSPRTVSGSTGSGGTGPGVAGSGVAGSGAGSVIGRPVVGRGRLDDGPALSDSVIRRLLDDSWLRAAVLDRDGRTVDLGRARRAPNAAQLLALWRRDRGCAVPGCGRIRFLHAHHVVFWSQGGETNLDNLVLLCGDHHRALHEGAFAVRSLGRQPFSFHARDGSSYAVSPRTEGSADALKARYAWVGSEDIVPDWNGTPMGDGWPWALIWTSGRPEPGPVERQRLRPEQPVERSRAGEGESRGRRASACVGPRRSWPGGGQAGVRRGAGGGQAGSGRGQGPGRAGNNRLGR